MTVVVAVAVAGVVGAEPMSVTKHDNPNGESVNSGTVSSKVAPPSRPATVGTLLTCGCQRDPNPDVSCSRRLVGKDVLLNAPAGEHDVGINMFCTGPLSEHGADVDVVRTTKDNDVVGGQVLVTGKHQGDRE